MNAKMTARIPFFALSLVLMVCSECFVSAQGDVNTPANCDEIRVRWQAFLEASHAVGTSSLSEPYLRLKEFRDLVETGPASVPCIMELEPGPFRSSLMRTITRAHIGGLAGLTREEAISKSTDTSSVIRKWWESRSEERFRDETLARVAAFRAELQAHPADQAEFDFSTEAGMNLKLMGIFALPTIIQQLREGQSDRFFFFLLGYWTEPYQEKEGILLMPEGITPSPEQMTREHWLEWWDKNSWQYEWMKDSRNN